MGGAGMYLDIWATIGWPRWVEPGLWVLAEGLRVGRWSRRWPMGSVVAGAIGDGRWDRRWPMVAALTPRR